MNTGRYFVIGMDGTRYGPADVHVLNLWAAEGRVTPSTLLELEGDGRQVPAAQVPGLNSLRAIPRNEDPYAHPSYSSTQTPTSGAQETQIAWVLGALSLAAGIGILCTPIGGIGGIIAGIFGINFAAKGERAGHLQAKNARILNIVGLVLSGLHLLSYPFSLIFR
ncbi:MAG: DUF4339 domain-containing protein [Fimbriimonadaceae bacterium]|nr:hypothetical protein [Chthonomonadaceae bacterium]MCO5296080.1 DUF4339 domain-containing protein [Fimbriimonadaceae bacterium]